MSCLQRFPLKIFTAISALHFPKSIETTSIESDSPSNIRYLKIFDTESVNMI
jgi:hypothetical protein